MEDLLGAAIKERDELFNIALLIQKSGFWKSKDTNSMQHELVFELSRCLVAEIAADRNVAESEVETINAILNSNFTSKQLNETMRADPEEALLDSNIPGFLSVCAAMDIEKGTDYSRVIVEKIKTIGKIVASTDASTEDKEFAFVRKYTDILTRFLDSKGVKQRPSGV